MLLQTFDNPVWTVGEVGSVYMLVVIAILFIGFLVSSTFIEMIRDIFQILKKLISK